MERTPKTVTRKKTPAATTRTLKSAASQRRTPTHEEIARRAREIFLESGCPPGRDEEFWLEAERQLQGGLKK